MTLDQIATRVQQNVDDEGAGFFTLVDDIYPSVNDAYSAVSVLTGCIEVIADINWVSGLVYYDMTQYLTRYYRPIAIYNSNTKRWLEPVSLAELKQRRYNWELSEGEPYFFVPLGYKHIAFHPTKTIAVNNMTILFKQYGGTLTGTDTPTMPNEHVRVLEQYSTYDLLAQAEEFSKSLKYWSAFLNKTEDIRKELRNRLSPDLMVRLKDPRIAGAFF